MYRVTACVNGKRSETTKRSAIYDFLWVGNTHFLLIFPNVSYSRNLNSNAMFNICLLLCRVYQLKATHMALTFCVIILEYGECFCLCLPFCIYSMT